jgi:predicted amidohydrolase YtcJ
MRGLVAVMSLLSVSALAASPDSSGPADLVLQDGDVLTQDPAQPRASAVAMRGERIVAIGDTATVAPLIGPHTRVLALHGRAVVPALTDAHAHLVHLGQAAARVDLRGCRSPDDCAHRLAGAGTGSAWLQGYGWDQTRFAAPVFPTHEALDRVVSDRPVWLERIDGHVGWASATALARAGIGRDTPDPPGGRIVRDAAGNATGIFVDHAMSLVTRAIPAPSAAELEADILRGQELALAAGLTEIHDMGLLPAELAAYRALAAAGRLKLRVYAFAAAADADALLAHPPAPATPFAHFTLRGIKLYADGALGSRGAALLAPYDDDPRNRGLTLTPEATVRALSRRARANGWQIAVHAIGDRGNREVLDAYIAAGVTAADRFRIEHAQVVALDDIPRFAAHGIIASMQPTHAVSDHVWAEARIGAARLRGAYAWRRMLDAGAPLAFGSDFPVEAPDIVAGLRAAVERAGWTLDQRLTLDEALVAFTTGAAFAAFEERWRGRAAVGQAADFTIFDAHAADLLHAHVATTIVGGRIVYEQR